MNPRYPVYIISKGRWESRLTSKALERMNVPYHIVVEPQEYENYAAVIAPEKILVLPFSNLGQGSIPARNWVWEHAISTGAKRHWILDDNIRDFYRLHKNIKWRLTDGSGFAVIEDFADRYSNIAICGMEYAMFAPRKEKCKPIVFNVRVYSCILIDNAIPYRWRGRYNEDTDLCLRALKDGWCTFLTKAFLAAKVATMQMKGGNTDHLYKQDKTFDGRLEMAKSLQAQHPDVTTIQWIWGRWQHKVDYSRFRKNPLRKIVTNPEPKDYGMELRHKKRDL